MPKYYGPENSNFFEGFVFEDTLGFWYSGSDLLSNAINDNDVENVVITSYGIKSNSMVIVLQDELSREFIIEVDNTKLQNGLSNLLELKLVDELSDESSYDWFYLQKEFPNTLKILRIRKSIQVLIVLVFGLYIVRIIIAY